MKPGPIQAANGPIAAGRDGILRDADGNPVIYQQRYGLHEINGVLRLNPAASARDKDVAACEKHVAAARSELEAAGEQTDLTIIMVATKGEPGPFPTAALYQWFGGLAARRGLGHLYLAAHFLATWQLTRAVAAEDRPLKEKTEWLGRFGESYGRWNEEHSKKHKAILKAQRVTAGSMRGAEGRKTKTQPRRSVILNALIDVIDNPSLTDGQIATQWRERVNVKLESAGHKMIPTDKALKKAVWRFRRKRQTPG